MLAPSMAAPETEVDNDTKKFFVSACLEMLHYFSDSTFQE